jgi:hypothetical protein
MQRISVNLTMDELQSTVSMMDNQLFRMKFIDSKLPGHAPRPEALRTAQAALQLFQEALTSARGVASVRKSS